MKLKLLSVLALSTFLSAETMQFTEFVKVSSSIAEYETTQERIAYQECHDEQVPVASGQSSSNSNVAGSVVGGAIGGVLGHQVGGGRGNDLATVGGAILGTIVGGNTIGANQQEYQQPQYQTRKNCITKYRSGPAQKTFVGYKNVAYYKGKKIVKYSNEKLQSIPITVTIDY